ncbi:MAG: hypothetical protein AAF297_06285 [Planctomycetota bacterium]
MSRARPWCAIVLTSAAITCGVEAAQPSGAPPSRIGDPTTGLRAAFPDLDTRLTALDPKDPSAYFLLAEEVAALARTDEDFQLAERLFVLAFAHDAQREAARPARHAAGSLRAPACLALAAITTSDRRARWLRAIAGVVDRRYAARDWTARSEPAEANDERERAAEAVASVRSGDGVRARRLLERPGVRRLVERYAGLLTGRGYSRVIGELESEAARWPCPECRNERVSVKRLNNTVERSLCHTCDGNPGWPLSRGGLIAALRFESEMLNGSQRSWGAQAAIDLGEPLRDPDPLEVAPTYRVDPALAYWRRGNWVASPETPPANDTPTTSAQEDTP